MIRGDGRRERIESKIYGGVGLYLLEDDADRWVVFLPASERRVVIVKTEAVARRVGEVLVRHCRRAIVLPTREGVLRRLPPWVEKWVRSMHDENWRNPEPFMREQS